MPVVDLLGSRRKPRSHGILGGLTTKTASVLGAPVGVAFPVQRRSPRLVMLACGAELTVLVSFVLTGSFAALVVLVLTAAVLMVLAATNRRLVLAVTADDVVILAASRRARPLAALGSVPRTTTLPKPGGFGVPLTLDNGIWWIDRSSFTRLQRARALDRR